MVEAPEKIWAYADSDGVVTDCGTEYLRADIAERQIAELRAELKMISNYLRPLVPSDQDPAQADSALGIIGYMALTLERAEAAEAENARLKALPLKDEVERVVEPFADAANHYDGFGITDEMTISGAKLPVGSIRAARALLSRLRAGEQEGWRSMDSAPKDAPILLDIGETLPDLADVRVGQWISEFRARELSEHVSASGGWLVWNTDSDWFVIPFDDAFGWMPLPAAPSEHGGERE